MDVDICCATFPWNVISVAYETPRARPSNVVRTVLDVALRGMFYTADAQRAHLQYPGGTPADKVAHCRAVRSREDQAALEAHIYAAAVAYLAEHHGGDGTFGIVCSQYPGPLRKAVVTHGSRCSRFETRAQAMDFYSRALAVFAADELALPLDKVPHVTRHAVDVILAGAPRAVVVDTAVPAKVLQCPEQVGRYLFTSHIRDIAAARQKWVSDVMLADMLAHVARALGTSPESAREAYRRLARPDRHAEAAAIRQDMYVLAQQQKMPVAARIQVPFHMSHPTEYLDTVDAINDGRQPQRQPRAKTALSCDDLLPAFKYNGSTWHNILDAATHSVCARMDPMVTPNIYHDMRRTLDRHVVYANVFTKCFQGKMEARLARAMAAKYVRPSERALIRAISATPGGRIVCRSGDPQLNDAAVKAFVALAYDRRAGDTDVPVGKDLSAVGLTCAWLLNTCLAHSKHYMRIEPPRAPTPGELYVVRRAQCIDNIMGPILHAWRRTGVTSLTQFAQYLCRRYLTDNTS